jgi:DNA-binding response OmpR family regulator
VNGFSRLLTGCPSSAIVKEKTNAREGSVMGGRVLLIEDEPNIIEAIRFILSRDGWAVDTHSDGATAMEAIRRRRPDGVILDAMLPNRSGYDILADLRAAEDTAALPVLMLTARGQTKDRELAERYGASRFMTKPFSNTDVLNTVREIVPR